ncbi:MAG TPA: hypothetical protein GYA06_05350 [Chloroflexi bacterium]|nr:hypothetical protein [Chloroflexota bacterium]
MPQIRTTCPRCKSPVLADVQQIVDVARDSQAKARLLNGSLNVMNCPNCGYQGMISTPLVYHDPDKELLLTYFPPELGLPMDQQEQQMGPLITQVVNNLPPEKRKAYLFRPQSMLTYQTLLERVLEAEGITKEMIEEQQQRLHLLQRLLSTPNSADRLEIFRQEEATVDETFFSLLNRLVEASLAQNDEQVSGALAVIQQEAMEHTAFGRKMKEQAQEAQEALRSLQEASKTGLTREKLLDLIISAPTDVRLNTLVSLTRAGLDYTFFQLLTDKIDAAEGEEKERLIELRGKILNITSAIDKQIQAQVEQSRQLLNQILQSENIEQATEQHLPEIDEFFMEALNAELQQARSQGDLERIGKLQRVNAVLEKASTPPPEVTMIERLLEVEDEDTRRQILSENPEMITPEFLQLLGGLVAQSQQQEQDPTVAERLQQIYSLALRFSMEQRLKS